MTIGGENFKRIYRLYVTMRIIIPLLTVFFLLFLIGCGTQQDINKLQGQLENVKQSQEKLQEETCAMYPYADGCDKVMDRIEVKNEQKELKETAIENLEFERCNILVEEKDLVSCQYSIVLELDDYTKCELLPKQTSWGATFRDACYLEYAKNNNDKSLCNKVTIRKEQCEYYFEIQDASSKELNLNIFEGDNSNMPRFIEVHDQPSEEFKIIWWAKDFEILNITSHLWTAKILIKTKSGIEKEIPFDLGFAPKEILFDDDPFAKELPPQICNENPSCNGVSWIYETESTLMDKPSYSHTFYCPNNLEYCQELINIIRNYNG